MTRIMGFCVGLGAGLAAGLLSAPRPGVKTRAQIQEKAEDGLRYVRRSSHQIQRRITRLKQRNARLVTSQGQAVKAALTAGKRAYQRIAG
jgi:gas vesicle protein